MVTSGELGHALEVALVQCLYLVAEQNENLLAWLGGFPFFLPLLRC